MRLFWSFLGFLPLVFGSVMSYGILASPNSVPPYFLIGILFLLAWAVISFLIRFWCKSSREVYTLLHLIPLLDLLLIGYQEMVLNAYWRHMVGILTQTFYLPLLRIGFHITPSGLGIFPACLAGLLLMLLASWLGCKLWEKRNKEQS